MERYGEKTMLLHTYAIKPDSSQGVATGLRITAYPHRILENVAIAKQKPYTKHSDLLKEMAVNHSGLGGRDPDGKLWVIIPEGHKIIDMDPAAQSHLTWIKKNLLKRAQASDQRRRKVR
jgi:hypothetical protein